MNRDGGRHAAATVFAEGPIVLAVDLESSRWGAQRAWETCTGAPLTEAVAIFSGAKLDNMCFHMKIGT